MGPLLHCANSLQLHKIRSGTFYPITRDHVAWRSKTWPCRPSKSYLRMGLGQATEADAEAGSRRSWSRSVQWSYDVCTTFRASLKIACSWFQNLLTGPALHGPHHTDSFVKFPLFSKTDKYKFIRIKSRAFNRKIFINRLIEQVVD